MDGMRVSVGTACCKSEAASFFGGLVRSVEFRQTSGVEDLVAFCVIFVGGTPFPESSENDRSTEGTSSSSKLAILSRLFPTAAAGDSCDATALTVLDL
jgi:hypothetical protein